MASGDTVFSQTGMYLALDDSAPGKSTTKLQHSSGHVVTVEKAVSGVQETVFDTSKTYDVTVKET